jgi:hypothetical protein
MAEFCSEDKFRSGGSEGKCFLSFRDVFYRYGFSCPELENQLLT